VSQHGGRCILDVIGDQEVAPVHSGKRARHKK
jgi:hypothetical protein